MTPPLPFGEDFILYFSVFVILVKVRGTSMEP